MPLIAGLTLTLLVWGGCRPDLYPLPRRPRQSSALVWRYLDALWFREGPRGKTVQGSSRIRASVAPNEEERVRVGVFEEHAGATGVQWHASVWLASFQASLALGRPLTAHRFNISVGGFIDGPSAGALMATGFLAVMTGAPIREHATVTGALVPGGGLGPVDGIPAKLLAAKKMGKRLVGIPLGQAVVQFPAGKNVDVRLLGRSLGLEVRELRDLRDAYRLMTGRQLPRVRPVPTSEMALGKAHAAVLRRRAMERVRDARLELGRRGGGYATLVRRHLKDTLERVRRLLAAGAPATAYFWAQEAAVWFLAARHLRHLSGGRPLGVRLDAVRARVREVKTALDDAVSAGATVTAALLESYTSLARAMGYLDVAEGIATAPNRRNPAGAAAGLRSPRGYRGQASLLPPQVLLQDEKGRRLLVATYLGRAQLSLKGVRDALAVRAKVYPKGRPSLRGLPVAARSFAGAASGNIQFVDALLLRQVAAEVKKTLPEVQLSFARQEASYLAARQLLTIVQDRDVTPPTLSGRLLRLGAAANAYVESALVITKYYSLDVDMPRNGLPPTCGRPRSLNAMLTNAELDARVAAAQVKDRLGTIPAAAKFHYQIGVQLTRGDLISRIQALGELWRAMVASKTARLSLNPGP